MSSVFQSSKIQFDRSSGRHLLCVEDEAIDLVLAKLEKSEFVYDSLKILYWCKTKNTINFPNIEQFNSLENLEFRLVEILNRAQMGTIFHAIGSEQFVGNLLKYARSYGLSEAEISWEIVSRKTKNVYCSNCQIINSLVRDNIFICSNCGIWLEVLEHFSRLKNAYLGISADAEIVIPSEDK